MKWRILVTGKEDPCMNMAIDESIYRSVCDNESPPTIRFYDWQPASFSYGYNQKLEQELDIEKVRTSEYGFVRRPTGGRLVLHEDEVTYSVIAPFRGEMNGSLTGAYLRIANALQKGFNLMNIEVDMHKATLTREHQKETNNPCFSSSSRYELTYKGKKIVGSAQVRNNKGFLQHGSILRSNNQGRVADFLPELSAEKRVRMKAWLSGKTTSISEVLGEYVSFDRAVESLAAGFQKCWQEESFYTDAGLTFEEKKVANALFKGKYRDIRWNENACFCKKVLTYNQD